MMSNSEPPAPPLSTGWVVEESAAPRAPTIEAAPLATQVDKVWKKPERSTLASVLAKPEALRPEKMPAAAWGSRAAVPPRKRGAAATAALPRPEWVAAG